MKVVNLALCRGHPTVANFERSTASYSKDVEKFEGLAETTWLHHPSPSVRVVSVPHSPGPPPRSSSAGVAYYPIEQKGPAGSRGRRRHDRDVAVTLQRRRGWVHVTRTAGAGGANGARWPWLASRSLRHRAGDLTLNRVAFGECLPACR